MLSIWTITKQKHANSAFTGESARLYGGRWNTPGTTIIYTAQSQALAVLEMLVHLDSPAILSAYLFFELLVEELLIHDIPITALPNNWRADPPPAETQALGDAWVANSTSPVLRVPSAIVPGEFNFLLNPVHADFRRLEIGKPTPFQLDPRLSKR